MIDTNEIAEVRELINNGGVLSPAEINALLDSHDELERKLRIAEDGLLEVIDWANKYYDAGMAGGFAIAKSTLKQIRGE